MSISSKGDTRALGSSFSVLIAELRGVDDLDTKVSLNVWVEDDAGKMLVEDGDVTLVVVDVADGGDKRWQDFSSSVVVVVVAVVVVEAGAEECWKCFWDWQEFSTATDRKLQSLVGMMILLVDVLEWADLF